MRAFICKQKAKSHQSKGFSGARKALYQNNVQTSFGKKELFNGDKYGLVYYFHNGDAEIDADNLSKPIWDSLRDHAYSDDKEIRYRTAAIIDLLQTDINSFDLSGLEPTLAEELLDAVANSNHFFYVEIGTFQTEMITFSR
jgi:hypothetical protein